MKLHLFFAFLTGSVLLPNLAIWANPIIIRHDRPDSMYVQLASDTPEAEALFRINKTDVAGTLISANYILTAAHVANDINTGDSVISKYQKYKIAEIVIHPQWEKDKSKDIALIRLNEAVKKISPVPLFEGRNEPDQNVLIIGNGDNGTGITGPTGNDGKIRAATNRVDEVSNRWLKWDFIDPRVDSVRVTEEEGISGPGDSGGPAFIFLNGRAYLAGISSGQSTQNTNGREGVYGVREYYVRISSHIEWIRSVLAD
jgi:hypothetical protein